MSRSPKNRHARLKATLLPLLLFASLGVTASVEAGDNSPVVPVPADRWGSLEPRAVAADTSSYRFNYEPGCNEPFWFDVDAEGGYLFTAAGNTVEVWDLRQAPEDPDLLQKSCRPVLGLFKKSDTDFYYFKVDAPPDDPSIFAAGLGSKMGVIVMDNRTPGRASILYQDEGSSTLGQDFAASDIVALKAGGRRLLFVRASTKDVLVYDLDRIQNLSSPCLQEDGCPSGTFLGILPNIATSMAGAGKNLILYTPGKISVYDVSVNPVSPTLVGTITPVSYLLSVAAWSSNGQTHVAGVGFNVTEAYNLSCLSTTCAGKATILTTPGSTYIKASKDGVSGRTYLYLGTANSNLGGSQLEYIFDTETWEELTPQTHPDGYWGWYYVGNSTGFNSAQPWSAVVYSGFIYRAAYSFLDVHEIVGAGRPPLVSFDWSPVTPYAGDPVSFTDHSTGAPNAWTWTFSGANLTSSSSQNPTGIQFLSAGQKNVTLVASNDQGAGDAITKKVTVLDPNPVINSITPNLTQAPVCSEVQFTASAVGKPPLSYDWGVVNTANEPQSAGGVSSSNVFAWVVPQDQAPGNYRATLTVSGVGDSLEVTSPVVAISALDALSFLDGSNMPVAPASYQPAASASDLGRVSFSVSAQGATRWTWDFGDGACPDGFIPLSGACTTTDPAVGEAPVHQYTVGETDYEVTVSVENCRDGSITSAATTVSVGAVAALEPKFSAQGICFALLGCAADVGQQITFRDETTGFPETYEMDWNGSGNFVSVTPSNGVFTHKYTQANETPGYKPVLRVTRGSQIVTFTHQAIAVSTGQPAPEPSVSVSRSTFTPVVNAAVVFTASANDCTAPTSWTWSVGSGGTINGSSTTKSINVSYSSAGSRTISATAVGGGCNGISGSTNVSVQSAGGDGGGGGGGGGSSLNASFTLAPSSPEIGTPVAFDASGSTGATGYVWDFGDGKTGSGMKPTHAYDAAGSYVVKLEASKPDPDCSFGICIATAQRTVIVSGEPPPPPVTNGCSGEDASADDKLCLLDGRFQVEVTFTDPEKGLRKAKAIWSSNKTGLFWFFRSTNVELIVKVLDGRPVNGNFWVFYNTLSNVPYEIVVTDLATNDVQRFSSLPASKTGQLCGGQFTDAFLGTQGGGAASSVQAGPQSVAAAAGILPVEDLYLLHNRFRVYVDFSYVNDDGDTVTGKGNAVAGTDQSGYFWFFNPDNLELVVKMVDARASFGNFWVFYNGLTSVQYTLTVVDTLTGTRKTYEKEEGGQCGLSDTLAFPETL